MGTRWVRPRPIGATRRCRTPGRLEMARLGGRGGGGGGSNCDGVELFSLPESGMIQHGFWLAKGRLRGWPMAQPTEASRGALG